MVKGFVVTRLVTLLAVTAMVVVAVVDAVVVAGVKEEHERELWK